MAAIPIPVSTEQMREAIQKEGSKAAAARSLGIPVSTLKARLDGKNNPEVTTKTVTYPVHPDDDIPAGELIEIMTRRAEKRLANAASRRWQAIKVHTSDPIVLAFVGDPHLDDDGCDWPTLRKHIELMKLPGVYSVNVGDSSNNWSGRLAHLYAKQETSVKTARKLIKWFLHESGIAWLVWVMGNHDEWASGSDIIRLMNTNAIVMEDWSAKFTVEFGNGAAVPVWVAHDFPGHSQWNKLHGPMKAAAMRGGAGIYACGHKHVAAMHWEPIEDHGGSFIVLRAKGYKQLDSYAVRIGHDPTDEGQTMAVVIDPRGETPALEAFKCLRAAVTYRNAIA